jgi:hypothetical protein
MKRLVIVALAVFAGPALAGTPETSLRPIARGAQMPAVVIIATPSHRRPEMRPPSEPMVSMAARGDVLPFASLSHSPRPWLRPPVVEQQAMSKRRARREGGVCGNLDIQGDRVGHVPGRIKGCGFDSAVSVRSISGVKLSRPATMDCTTANALNEWVGDAVIPAFKRNGGGVVGLRVAAHYACRTRNNKPGARISEHGKGKAIDISAFIMESGKVVTVIGDWGKGKSGRALAKVHKKACGPFGTVLGPKVDRHHQDHFHMDTASYRSGAYCR